MFYLFIFAVNLEMVFGSWMDFPSHTSNQNVCVCVLIIINKQPQHAGETTGMLTEQIWTNRTHRIYVWYIYDHLCIFTIIYLHLVDICCI